MPPGTPTTAAIAAPATPKARHPPDIPGLGAGEAGGVSVRTLESVSATTTPLSARHMHEPGEEASAFP